jgi:hypothetical protein
MLRAKGRRLGRTAHTLALDDTEVSGCVRDEFSQPNRSGSHTGTRRSESSIRTAHASVWYPELVPGPATTGHAGSPNRTNRFTKRLSETGATGLEPAASGVTGRRSNQLSYAPGQTITGWPGVPARVIVGAAPASARAVHGHVAINVDLTPHGVVGSTFLVGRR